MSRVYCIAFGLNCVDRNAYDGWDGILRGCVPDAIDEMEQATKFGDQAEPFRPFLSGWDIADTRKLPWTVTLDATRAKWVSEHRRIQSLAQPGDWVLASFSGHGGTYTRAIFGQGETLCFVDGQFTDVEQHELCKGWKAGVRVVYSLDACHSGGMDKVAQALTPRALPRAYNVLTHNPPDYSREQIEGMIKGDGVVAQIAYACACLATETAADGAGNGAWTASRSAALDQLFDGKQVVTPDSWFATARSLCEEHFDQHPVLKTIGDGASILDTPIGT